MKRHVVPNLLDSSASSTNRVETPANQGSRVPPSVGTLQIHLRLQRLLLEMPIAKKRCGLIAGSPAKNNRTRDHLSTNQLQKTQSSCLTLQTTRFLDTIEIRFGEASRHHDMASEFVRLCAMVGESLLSATGIGRHESHFVK
jgi:hypothetical protein